MSEARPLHQACPRVLAPVSQGPLSTRAYRPGLVTRGWALCLGHSGHLRRATSPGASSGPCVGS
jgi:hypothetical protein